MEEKKKKGCGCLTALYVISALVFFGVIINGIEKLTKTAPTSPPPKVQSFPEPTQPEKMISAAEHLAAAKQNLADKNKTTPYGNIFQASQYLEKIKPGDKEYAEAKKLLKYIANCYKELDRPVAQKRQKNAKDDGLSAGEDAGLRLFALQSRGHIRMTIAEPSTFIEVEPISWASMMPQDKEKMCQLAKSFISGLNQTQGKKIDFIFFKDMTSRATLAEVCLKDGRISINK